MSSLLSYHIFSFFISNIFENFKFGRNFSKFTAGMGCRLVAVSVKIGGNRRLPIGKENTAGHTPFFLVYGLEAILPTEQQFWVLLHNHCQLFDICYFGSSVFLRYVHNAKFQFKRTTRHSNLFLGIRICHNSYLYVYSTKTCHSFNTV